jgi:hypothetical protein
MAFRLSEQASEGPLWTPKGKKLVRPGESFPQPTRAPVPPDSFNHRALALSVVASRGIATHPGQLKALLKTWHLVALFGRNDILPSYLGEVSPPRRVFPAARFLLAGKLLDRPTSIGVTGAPSVFPAGA